MPRYFFDTRVNGDLLRDEYGLELPDLDAVKDQAAVSLAELAHDLLPGSVRRKLSVEARDERQPILRAVLKFEAEILVSNAAS